MQATQLRPVPKQCYYSVLISNMRAHAFQIPGIIGVTHERYNCQGKPSEFLVAQTMKKFNIYLYSDTV